MMHGRLQRYGELREKVQALTNAGNELTEDDLMEMKEELELKLAEHDDAEAAQVRDCGTEGAGRPPRAVPLCDAPRRGMPAG